MTFMDFLCAQRGATFTVGITLQEGVWKISSIGKSRKSADALKGGVSQGLTIATEKIDWSAFECPHCRAKASPSFAWVRCSTCERFTCMGRTANGIWHCASDCGHQWPIEEMSKVDKVSTDERAGE